MKIIRNGREIKIQRLEKGQKFIFGENLYMKWEFKLPEEIDPFDVDDDVDYTPAIHPNCIDLDTGGEMYVPLGKKVIRVDFGDVELITI